ncbi:50S ribosomal protein L11 methyltransferase [Chitinophaga cymbidii]|uniref:Ribosomal protein L11 methyltransferase n=1 Tax=Chitinophaga cymbidii TaxID=1096750 RepID=A0A512RE04_9BACT|nr:50S ribosomal protein L11 methyltransferase [Chitinophaga cymbidii]GEP93854.1 ribosomal protein L11 methyltransferase [Chitinophaga cymbidii]
MSYIAITVSAPSELRDILVAQLSDAGYEGFEETTDTLVAYIPENIFSEPVLQEILRTHGLDYTKETIAQANWNAVWESSFQPVLVDDFCGIRAGFHEPLQGKVMHEIIITPKMSFGTGHHATTWSMIKLMRDVDFTGKKVFDFGTGTGILAILAEKMGAAETDAIDIDTWAVENSLENAAANNATHIRFRQADHLNDIPAQSYDIILANINRNILLANMGNMKKILRTGGLLILSGILQEDEPAIVKAAVRENLRPERKSEREHWLALSFTAG